eukprot:768572-Hanusia_phi.AAC.3
MSSWKTDFLHAVCLELRWGGKGRRDEPGQEGESGRSLSKSRQGHGAHLRHGSLQSFDQHVAQRMERVAGSCCRNTYKGPLVHTRERREEGEEEEEGRERREEGEEEEEGRKRREGEEGEERGKDEGGRRNMAKEPDPDDQQQSSHGRRSCRCVQQHLRVASNSTLPIPILLPSSFSPSLTPRLLLVLQSSSASFLRSHLVISSPPSSSSTRFSTSPDLQQLVNSRERYLSTLAASCCLIWPPAILCHPSFPYTLNSLLLPDLMSSSSVCIAMTNPLAAWEKSRQEEMR